MAVTKGITNDHHKYWKKALIWLLWDYWLTQIWNLNEWREDIDLNPGFAPQELVNFFGSLFICKI